MPRGRRSEDESPVSFFSFQDVMMCTIGITIITTLILVLQLGRTVSAAAEQAVPTPSEESELRSLEEAREVLARRLSREELERDTSAEDRLAADALALHLTAEDLDRLEREVLEARSKLRQAVQERRADDRALVALELMERRDELQAQLRDLNSRRRIVYLVAPSDTVLPMVTEIAGGRVVVSTDQAREAPMALPSGDPEQAARAILAVFRSLPDRDRRYFLLVVKPSGIPTYLRLKALLAGDPATRDVRIGLDLIPEDCWTTDEFPAADAGTSETKP
jgi:hypothetical protein